MSDSLRAPAIRPLALAAFFAFAAPLFGVAGVACSSDVCEDTDCVAGNKCIAVGGVTACRKVCTSNTAASEACPFGYACTSLTDRSTACSGNECYCAESTAKFAKKPAGLFGANCNTSGGVAENPDCDATQAFQCFAQSPGDGSAYCTHACATDTDCPGAYFCGDVNDSPNAESNKRVGTGTIRICQKRSYCSPCKATVDCGAGLTCIRDAQGVGYCSNACGESKNCNDDATCEDVEGGSYCVPIAKTCRGDGKLCSPCRADNDCTGGGICAVSSYTTERFCSEPSASACGAEDCKAPNASVKSVGCITGANAGIPKGHCTGLFKLGGNPVPGCYSTGRGR